MALQGKYETYSISGEIIVLTEFKARIFGRNLLYRDYLDIESNINFRDVAKATKLR